MDPARIFTESLTPRPELENSQDPERTSQLVPSPVASVCLITPEPSGRQLLSRLLRR